MAKTKEKSKDKQKTAKAPRHPPTPRRKSPHRERVTSGLACTPNKVDRNAGRHQFTRYVDIN